MRKAISADEVFAVVMRARPAFAGCEPEVVGAALADLTAMWLASHVIPGDPAETDRMRGRLMLMHGQKVRALTALNAEALGT